MNCLNCGTELPELIDGMAQCGKCGTVFKSHVHTRENTGALLTVFLLGDYEHPPSPSEVNAFAKAMKNLELKSGNNFLMWRGTLTIEQFDVYPDKGYDYKDELAQKIDEQQGEKNE